MQSWGTAARGSALPCPSDLMHIPDSVETQRNENTMGGKSRESLLRWMQKPQSYGKPCTACVRGLKTTTKLSQFLQGWPRLETSLKTKRHLKSLLCPSPSPGNSLRSQLGGTPSETQLLGWAEVCTSTVPF